MNADQRRRTSEELQDNYRRARVSAEQVWADLGVDADELHAVLAMTVAADPVALDKLRDYLSAAIAARGEVPTPYTHLSALGPGDVATGLVPGT